MSGMQSKFSNCGCPTGNPTAGFNGNPFSPENIKIAYESNPDTNAFTDADKEKLNGLEEGVKAQVLNLTGGTNTMGQEIIMAGFTIQELGEAVEDTDATNLGQVKQLIKDAPNSTTFVQEETPDVLSVYETIEDAQGATWYLPSEKTTYIFYVDPNGVGQWSEEDSVGDDGGSSFNFTQEEAPTENLFLGARWFKPSTSQEFIYYVGPNEVGVWTEANDTGDNVSLLSFDVTDLPVYADEAAAASLTSGSVYRTATGELRYKL